VWKRNNFLASTQNRVRSVSPDIFLDPEKYFNEITCRTCLTRWFFSRISRFSFLPKDFFSFLTKKLTVIDQYSKVAWFNSIVRRERKFIQSKLKRHDLFLKEKNYLNCIFHEIVNFLFFFKYAILISQF